MTHELPPLGFALKASAFLSGADPEILRRSPPRDHSSVLTITLIMLGVWLWQTFAFTLAGHMLLDESSRIRPELIAIAALLATLIMLIDSYGIIRSSWAMQGYEQLKQGGLDVPGHLGMKIKNGVQNVFRIAQAAVFSQLVAWCFMLFIFTPEIVHRLNLNAMMANAPLQQSVAVEYDATTMRLVTEIGQLQEAQAKARTDAGAFRLDALQPVPEEPELKPAIAFVQRAEGAKLEAERRLARVPSRDDVARRLAIQRLAARKADLQKAQERVDRLREETQTRVTQRHDAIQSRLGETQSAEQRYAERIDALEKARAARVAAREDSIRAVMQRDPGFQTSDRGLLARARTLGQLMDDPWTFTVATLLHLFLFGVELGAVLSKILTFIPSSYAAILAGEELAHNVEVANWVYARISAATPPSNDNVPEELALTGHEGMTTTPVVLAPANDDAAVEALSNTAARLQVGAAVAKEQAAARAVAAKARGGKKGRATPRTTAGEPEAVHGARDDHAPDPLAAATLSAAAPTLAENILDGPVRRGRGRPPGSKTRPVPASDAGTAGDSDVA